MNDQDYRQKQIDEIVRQIQIDEPDYVPPQNVVQLRQKTTPECLVPLTYKQLKVIDIPPKDFVLEPCIEKQGICFIYAATGVGKTLFALNMAYAIAQGGSFLKYTCPKPRKVLYIDGEMPISQMQERLSIISATHGDLDYEDNLSILNPDKVLPYKIPKIDDTKGQEIYLELIAHNNYEVIVFDNLSVLTSLDENKAEEWGKLQDWFLHLRAMGKTLLVVHHAGKAKDGYRGSSKMLDCVDTAISLQPVEEDIIFDECPKEKKLKVIYQKSRRFWGKDAMPFEIVLSNNVWSHRSMAQNNLDKICEMVNTGMTQREIAKAMNLSQPSVHRLIAEGRKLGKIFK